MNNLIRLWPKLSQIVAVLFVCMAMGAGVACQFHTTQHDHAPATLIKYHTTPDAHSVIHFFCYTAVLPAMMFFTSLFCFWFYATPLLLKHTAPVFPPFIPPRYAVY